MGMLRARAHDLQDAPEDLRRYEIVIELFCNGVARPARGCREEHSLEVFSVQTASGLASREEDI